MSKQHWDNFFYYGKNTQLDCENDIISGCLQPSRSLFFDRQDSAGIKSKENYPNSIALYIGIQYALAKWIAYRNGYVNTESPDMRVAVSQENIVMEYDRRGGMQIDIKYILLENYTSTVDLKIPMFGGVA